MQFDAFEIIIKINQILFYVICVLSIFFAWVAYQKNKNIGFILIGIFFLADFGGHANVEIKNIIKPKYQIQEIKKQSETKTIYQHAYFPLGEILLLVALYKLSENKKQEIKEKNEA